ncbi:MAG: MarR family transcriptional regulator [Erythrobacter sp.]|uniref:MarR family winged helix-turn-helix transcriptional regulator n=1 Tax=Erythrobacter sp. TaxID=1042 RepID=UPI002635DD15|nr:MarR family transcriptional regulator [Erythrobacter sp.]MDJ0977019.1 MarR family transcriptional regulator [Erythrobacter sp.]
MGESQTNELLDAMRALQTALDRHDFAVSAARSIGRSDWRCLQALVAAGGLSPRAIQQELGLTSGSVTALIDRLEDRHLVARRPDPADRRAIRVEPLEAAHRLVVDASVSLFETTDRLSERWGGERTRSTRQACHDLARLVEWASQRV